MELITPQVVTPLKPKIFFNQFEYMFDELNLIWMLYEYYKPNYMYLQYVRYENLERQGYEQIFIGKHVIKGLLSAERIVRYIKGGKEHTEFRFDDVRLFQITINDTSSFRKPSKIDYIEMVTLEQDFHRYEYSKILQRYFETNLNIGIPFYEIAYKLRDFMKNI